MTVYELLTLYKPYELLFDISSSVNFNDVVSRMERPSITGKVSVLHLMIYVTEFQKTYRCKIMNVAVLQLKPTSQLAIFVNLISLTLQV